MANIKIEYKKTGSCYIVAYADTLKSTTLKNIIYQLQEDNYLTKDSKIDLINTVKSKLAFNKIVEHKQFFSNYKEMDCNCILVYLYNNFDFNIFPSGVKIK